MTTTRIPTVANIESTEFGDFVIIGKENPNPADAPVELPAAPVQDPADDFVVLDIQPTADDHGFDLMEETQGQPESAEKPGFFQSYAPQFMIDFVDGAQANINAVTALAQPNPMIQEAMAWVPTVKKVASVGTASLKLGSIGLFAVTAPYAALPLGAATAAAYLYDRSKGDAKLETTKNTFGFAMYAAAGLSPFVAPWTTLGLLSAVGTTQQNMIRGAGIMIAGINIPRPVILPGLALLQAGVKLARRFAPKALANETFVEAKYKEIAGGGINFSENVLYNMWSAIAHSITEGVVNAAAEIADITGVNFALGLTGSKLEEIRRDINPAYDFVMLEESCDVEVGTRVEKDSELEVDGFVLMEMAPEASAEKAPAAPKPNYSLLSNFTLANFNANKEALAQLMKPHPFIAYIQSKAPIINPTIALAGNALKIASIGIFWAASPALFSVAVTAVFATALYDLSTDNKAFENTRNVAGLALHLVATASLFVAPWAALGLASLASTKSQDMIRGVGIGLGGVDIPKPLILPVLAIAQLLTKIAPSIMRKQMPDGTVVDRLVLTVAEKAVNLANYSLYQLWSSMAHTIAGNLTSAITGTPAEAALLFKAATKKDLHERDFEDLGDNVQLTMSSCYGKAIVNAQHTVDEDQQKTEKQKLIAQWNQAPTATLHDENALKAIPASMNDSYYGGTTPRQYAVDPSTDLSKAQAEKSTVKKIANQDIKVFESYCQAR